MKKDIEFTQADQLQLAVVQEYSDTFKTNDWYIYLINSSKDELQMVLIVSKGESNKDTTSTMRHKLEQLPPQSAAKVELIQPEVLSLNNHFQITCFCNGSMLEKTFVIKANTVKEGALRHIKILNKKGVLIK